MYIVNSCANDVLFLVKKKKGVNATISMRLIYTSYTSHTIITMHATPASNTMPFRDTANVSGPAPGRLTVSQPVYDDGQIGKHNMPLLMGKSQDEAVFFFFLATLLIRVSLKAVSKSNRSPTGKAAVRVGQK